MSSASNHTTIAAAPENLTQAGEMALILKALALAAQAHRGGKRADGQDYIEHPIEVARNLAEAGITDVKQLAAALLHDALEKGPPSMRTLIALDLGDDVLQLVEALTDDPNLLPPERKALQLDRAAGMPPAARAIKLADRLANLRSPRPEWTQRERQRYAVHSYALLEALQGSHELLEAQLLRCLSLPCWRL
ncbi:MAG: HD domain-containing protein [Azoarcus sp.]|jgi:(p)ppGpp synthase/HD superfamily hydrolase|nr:HD domain-containing protein [Azoarcus sp.]